MWFKSYRLSLEWKWTKKEEEKKNIKGCFCSDAIEEQLLVTKTVNSSYKNHFEEYFKTLKKPFQL